MTDRAFPIFLIVTRVSLILVAGFLLVAVLLQIAAERDVRRLCAELGGLRGFKPIAPDSVYSEIETDVADADLPVATDQIKLLPAQFGQKLRRCETSTVCMNAIYTKSRASYAESKSPSFLIGWDPSPHCRSGVEARLQPSLAAYAARQSALLGKQISVCSAAGVQDVLIVTPTAYSVPTANPFRRYVHYRTWALFSARANKPVLTYAQFGVQTIAAKADQLIRDLSAVPSADYSANRCDAGQGQNSAIPTNVGLIFDAGSTYPMGIHKQDTSND